MTNADTYIENLRVYVRRNKDRFTLSNRFLTIIKILKTLSEQGFDFNLVAQTHEKEVKLLKSQENGMGWDYLTAEVVRFDNWFMCVAEQQPYALVI